MGFCKIFPQTLQKNESFTYFKEAFNKRKRGEVVRLELLKSISPNHFNFIKKNIPLNDAHIIYFKKILGIQSFSEIVDLDFNNAHDI